MNREPLNLLRIFILASVMWGGFVPLSAASVPHLVNLQGRLTDVSGTPIQSATPVEFRIFQGGDPNTADSGSLVYREVATITPGPDGSYTHLLGGGSAIAGFQFTPAIFDTPQNIYLQLEINNQALLPRLQIVSAGTAMLTEFPVGFIGMFAQDCPAGWTRFTNLDGLFPRGADSGVLGGGTGGSATTNTASGVVFSSGQGTGSFFTDWKRADNANPGSPVSTLPPYLNVVYCQKS